MKVKHTFFCTQERKKYYPGDEYTGKRTDINHLLDVKEEKIKYEDKQLKLKSETKQKGRPKKQD